MTNLAWIVAVIGTVVIVGYFALRRLVVANILGHLVAGAQADPLRAKQVAELICKRDRLNPDSNESQRVEDELARLDPMCAYGQQDLLQVAWEIYRQTRWTPPSQIRF